MKSSSRNNVPTFEQLFRRNIAILTFMGLPSMNGIFFDKKYINKWWELGPMIIGIMILFTIMSFQMISMWPISSDIFEYILELFPFVLSGVVSTIKLIRLYTYRSEFYQLLQKIKSMWESAKSENRITESIAKRAERTKLLTNYYSSLIAFVCFTHLIYPYIFIFKYQLHKEVNSSYDFSGTVFPCVYPLEIDSYLKYFILITYEQIDVVIACTAWACCDTLFAQLTTHITLQFMVNAKDVTEAINNYSVSITDHHQVKSKLKNTIVRYRQLFSYCNMIKVFFSPVIFVTVVSNALNLCCGIYRLNQEITAGNWNAIGTNIVYITSVTLQTVVFCIFAEDLSKSSTIIGDAVYHSRWEDCEQKIKIIILIIMMRARKEFTYTAYSLIDVNYNQLKQIANATISYFMLLRSL